MFTSAPTGWFGLFWIVICAVAVIRITREHNKAKHSEWDERVEQEKWKILAEEENSWLANNNPTSTSTTDDLETDLSLYNVPLSKGSSQSNWYEDDNDNYSDLSATVTYSIMDAPEEECDLDNLSSRDLQRLKAADDDGEYLDSDYISEHMHSIHNKIIEAIRDDLESKTGDPHDGIVEKSLPWGATYWEKDHASHQEMSYADDYEIEYTVEIF